DSLICYDLYCVSTTSGKKLRAFSFKTINIFHNLHCPKYHNPADYIIEIVNNEYGSFSDQLVAAIECNKATWRAKSSEKSAITPFELKKFLILFDQYFIQFHKNWTVVYLKLFIYFLVVISNRSSGIDSLCSSGFHYRHFAQSREQYLHKFGHHRYILIIRDIILFKHMPKYLYYFSYFNYLKYTFEDLVQSIYGYNREKFKIPDDLTYCLYNHKLEIEDDKYWLNVLVLIIFFVFYRIVSYYMLKRNLLLIFVNRH
ncbi:ATP-binding cassette sub-family G member 1-like, partial [Vespula squamosa]